jgi:hypothetical protein
MKAPLEIKIFLSSPGDVADERGLAARIVKQELPYDPLFRGRLTFDLISWNDPAAPTPMLANLTPQEAITRGLPRPSECDFVVVVLWARLGTPLPEQCRKANGERYLSGTEWEFENALKAADDARKEGRELKPRILIYRRTEDPRISLKDPEIDEKRKQYTYVNQFFENFKNPDGSLKRSFVEYSTPSEFADEMKRNLHALLTTITTELIRQEERDNNKSKNKAALELPWPGSPYPGLRAFTPEEEEIFFGRGNEVDKLLQLLRDPKYRFLAVVGASGTGKSSLVRAGLSPRLKKNAIEGSKDWRVLDFKPGALENPFELLAVKLNEMLPAAMQHQWPRELAARLQNRAEWIGILAEQVLAGSPEWAELLLFVDQFEELFTPSVEESYRSPFITMLACAATSKRMRVVVTLRADFLIRAAESATKLSELLQAGTFLLAPPREVALSEMIRHPAERAGLKLEDGLADEILKDAGTDPGALPLMAFCLQELYQQTVPDHRLTCEAYHEVGGLKGAISHQATQVIERLSTETREALPWLFQALVHVDVVTGAATRQRVNRSAIETDEAATELLEALINVRLLQAGEHGKGRQPTVELAHEALFDAWPQLQDWLRDNHTLLQRRTEIEIAMVRWDRENRDPRDLLTGKQLAEAMQLASQRPYFLTSSIRLYVKLSQEREKHIGNLSPEDINRFIHEQAYKVSEERRSKRAEYLRGIFESLHPDEIRSIFMDANKLINVIEPEDEERRVSDWHIGKMRFISDILEGNLNFALRISPEAYPQLEREWLEDFKKHRAYLIWEARGRGFDLDSGLSNYHAACEWIVERLTDGDMKMPEQFEAVRKYIESQLLNSGKLDTSKSGTHELIGTKARRLHQLLRDMPAEENWCLAENQVKIYYENIIPAVEGNPENVRQIICAIEPAQVNLRLYDIVNCFEITLVTYFVKVNMNIIQV